MDSLFFEIGKITNEKNLFSYFGFDFILPHGYRILGKICGFNYTKRTKYMVLRYYNNNNDNNQRKSLGSIIHHTGEITLGSVI